MSHPHLHPPGPPADEGEPAALPEVAEWSYATRRLALAVLIIAGVFLLWLARSALPMLLIAMVLAFMVRPLIQRIQARGVPHTGAVLAVYGMVALVSIAVLVVVLPLLTDELQRGLLIAGQLLSMSPEDVAQLLETYRTLSIGEVRFDLSPLVDGLVGVVGRPDVPADLSLITRLLEPAQQILVMASGFVIGTLALLIKGFLAFVISLYLSLEAPTILRHLEAFMGQDQSAETRYLLRRVADSWQEFLRGQFVLMVVIGTVVTLGDLALGLPGAVALGLLAGLFEVLPNIGPVLATIPAVVVALLAGSQTLDVSNGVFALIILGFYILVQQLENSLIVPRIIGRAVALPSVLIMIAVIVGAEVGGVIGAFVAAPTMATIRDIAAYTLNKVRGVDPYPELRIEHHEPEEPEEPPPDASVPVPVAGKPAEKPLR